MFPNTKRFRRYARYRETDPASALKSAGPDTYPRGQDPSEDRTGEQLLAYGWHRAREDQLREPRTERENISCNTIT